jgi:cobalt-precorrin 5A hydrolase
MSTGEPQPGPSRALVGTMPRAGAVTDGADIVAGVGFRSACAAEEIVALVRRALAAAGRSPQALAALAVPADRAQAPPLREAAARLGVTVLPVEPASLAAADAHVATHSVHAQAAYGVGSVAEAAALAAAGGTHLVLPRLASPAATCALARRAVP